MIPHVYLSPHLDDAALSCGGTIFRQTQAGQRVLVINIFAGAPDYRQLSPFARKKHATWGSPGDVVAARRGEDRAALAVLGAGVVYWDYLDCVYRVDGTRVLYPNEASLFGDVDPSEVDLLKQLAEEVDEILERAGGSVCYAPLAIGHHVDHQLVRDVGLLLVVRGRRVRFYEDFPYVWRILQGDASSAEASRGEAGGRSGFDPDTSIDAPALPLPMVLQRLGHWESDARAIDIEPKIAATACYKSQVGDLFGSEEAMAKAVTEYARLVGRDDYAERFWQLVPAGATPIL